LHGNIAEMYPQSGCPIVVDNEKHVLERFKIIDGTRYHHILDPRIGYPGTLSQSATTIASAAEEADVLATCLFLMGSQQAAGSGKLGCPFFVVAADGTIHYNDLFASTHHFRLEEDRHAE